MSDRREHESLSFRTLRKANLARLPHFRNAKGETVHEIGDGYDWSPSDWVCALVGEVGKLANLVKKIHRGDLSYYDAKRDLEDEIADVQTYLDLLAHRLGVNLERATTDKWNEVSARVQSPLIIVGDSLFDEDHTPNSEKGSQHG